MNVILLCKSRMLELFWQCLPELQPLRRAIPTAHMFSTNEKFYNRIFEAWSASPYGDYLRPVYVDVEGEFDPNSDPDKPQVFHVETVRSVTINFTEAQAKRAFELRMGPRSWQRTKERSEQPSERGRITDALPVGRCSDY